MAASRRSIAGCRWHLQRREILGPKGRDGESVSGHGTEVAFRLRPWLLFVRKLTWRKRDPTAGASFPLGYVRDGRRKWCARGIRTPTVLALREVPPAGWATRA